MASRHLPFFSGDDACLKKGPGASVLDGTLRRVASWLTIFVAPSHGVLLKANLHMFGFMAVPPHNTYTTNFYHLKKENHRPHLTKYWFSTVLPHNVPELSANGELNPRTRLYKNPVLNR